MWSFCHGRSFFFKKPVFGFLSFSCNLPTPMPDCQYKPWGCVFQIFPLFQWTTRNYTCPCTRMQLQVYHCWKDWITLCNFTSSLFFSLKNMFQVSWYQSHHFHNSYKIVHDMNVPQPMSFNSVSFAGRGHCKEGSKHPCRPAFCTRVLPCGTQNVNSWVGGDFLLQEVVPDSFPQRL